ncbi:MAG TPA: hypothetical protein VGL71_02825 [Urbifossiella sp.]|jgi:hypothetical protein
MCWNLAAAKHGERRDGADELAYTNALESRHAVRHEGVEELLRRNQQHQHIWS